MRANRGLDLVVDGVVARVRAVTGDLSAWDQDDRGYADVPVGPPLHRLAADLHRLESEAERLLGDPSVLARGQRLLAVRMAYDLVMLDAARALEVPVPHDRAPFTSHERFMVSVGLTAAGLRW